MATTMTTLTTKHSSLMARLRCWLVFRLMRKGIELQVEVRHGAFRARHKEIWKGGLVRAEIPVQKPNGKVGDLTTLDVKRMIHNATGERAHDFCIECNGTGRRR